MIDAIAGLQSPQVGAQIVSAVALTDADILITALTHEAPAVRWRAATQLGWIGRGRLTARDPLIALLADATWDARCGASWALGLIAEGTGDAEAFAALHVFALRGVGDEQSPYVAALGMLRIDPQRARTILEGAAAGEDEVARRVARSALLTFDERRASA